MNLQMDPKEFELLLEELQDSNPDMSPAQILELASMVNHVHSMPEIDPPTDLFNKISEQIKLPENCSEESTIVVPDLDQSQSVSLLNQIVLSISRHIVPFSGGAVAMLVLVMLFDGPMQHPQLQEDFYKQVELRTSSDTELINETKAILKADIESQPALAAKVLPKPSVTPAAKDSNKAVVKEQNLEQSEQQITANLDQKSKSVVKRPDTVASMASSAEAQLKAAPSMRAEKFSATVKQAKMRSDIGTRVRSNRTTKKNSFYSEPSESVMASKMLAPSSGAVRSGLMASLNSRSDDWIAQPKLVMAQTKSSSTALKKSDNNASKFRAMASISAMGTDSEISADESYLEENSFDETLPPVIQKTAEKIGVLELQWIVPLSSLSKARNILEAFDSNYNHIRHLDMSNLEDYSEIRGVVTADTYLIKLNIKRLSELINKVGKHGFMQVMNLDGSKKSVSLEKFLEQQSVNSENQLWETQLLILVTG